MIINLVATAATAQRPSVIPECPVIESGGRGNFRPPAPTDPGVNLSVHRALVILITRCVGPKEPMPSAQRGGDSVP
jgi:hypothetical protein